ncbi:MAG: GNAT family N-acetyltransferase [Oscillospiraceae bacterium]
MLFPADWRCPLSDYYMKTADSPSGKAFFLKDNEKPVAYAVLVQENEGWVLKYIFTDKNERQKGYASYLIREIVLRAEKYLGVHILRSHPFFDAISARRKAVLPTY